MEISDFPRRVKSKYPPVSMSVVECEKCGLVQLEYSAPREWMYRDYYYRSGLNESMVKALYDVADSAKFYTGLKDGDTVIDIGANDGTLLSFFPKQSTVAFEPALNLGRELSNRCNIMIPDFFPPKEEYKGPKAKVITSIAMFYDLENPIAFVKEIERVLHKDGVWIVQFTDLRAMVEVNAWDSFCHEHLCYYSAHSFMAMLIQAETDLTIVDVERNDVNGGSVRYYLKHSASGEYINGAFENLQNEFAYRLPDLKDFVAKIHEIRNKVNDFVDEERAKGKVFDVLGASTKGNTLLQFFGLDSSKIRRAIDRNPDKEGRFTVGTWIPIVNEQEGRVWPADVLIALPWHFKEGLVAREHKYLEAGGRILFPMPEPVVVDKDGEVKL